MEIKNTSGSTGLAFVVIVLGGSSSPHLRIDQHVDDSGKHSLCVGVRQDMPTATLDRIARIRAAKGRLRHLRSGGTERLIREESEDAAAGY
jgi:hypothetical protein